MNEKALLQFTQPTALSGSPGRTAPLESLFKKGSIPSMVDGGLSPSLDPLKEPLLRKQKNWEKTEM